MRHWFALSGAMLALLLAGCGGGGDAPSAGPSAPAPPPDRVGAAPPSSSGGSQKATAGSSFNKLFPNSGGGYERVFTQEKSGYAQADLMSGGKKLATLSISDTNANPSARSKFQSAGKQIAGCPAAEVGSGATAILVNNRYQVQIRSNAPTFSAQDREAWLQKFNLAGIAGL